MYISVPAIRSTWKLVIWSPTRSVNTAEGITNSSTSSRWSAILLSNWFRCEAVTVTFAPPACPRATSRMWMSAAAVDPSVVSALSMPATAAAMMLLRMVLNWVSANCWPMLALHCSRDCPAAAAASSAKFTGPRRRV